MNTTSICINLPLAGAPPHDIIAALAQGMAEATSRGDSIGAAAIGSLLQLASIGASHSAPVGVSFSSYVGDGLNFDGEQTR